MIVYSRKLKSCYEEMSFEVLKGVEKKQEGIEKIKTILNLIGLDSNNLNVADILEKYLIDKNSHYEKLMNLFISKFGKKDYPISSYTPKRLQIAIDKFESKKSKRELLLEVLSRLYYDSCNQGDYYTLDYPPLIQIEIASRCNYKCVFCYQSDKTFSQHDSKYMGFMDIKLFKEIIDQIHGNIPYITFASRGEPTLHPDFAEILAYCKGKFSDIKINTNASILNRSKIKAILDVCHTIVFSIDTPDPEQYPNIRVGGNLNNVIKNIKSFNEARELHPRKNKINTRASGVLFKPSIQSEEDYREVFGPLFDQTAFVKYNPWEKIYTLPDNNISKPCHQPFYRFFVWFDGTYNCCDMDYKSMLLDGCTKISQNFSIKDAWTSERMKEIRDLHNMGKRKTLDPCKKCPINS